MSVLVYFSRLHRWHFVHDQKTSYNTPWSTNILILIICHTGMLYSTYGTSVENTEFAFCSFVCPVFVYPLHDWALCISAAWAVSYWVATACVASHFACGEMLCCTATKVLGRRLESHDRSKTVMLTRLLNMRRCDSFLKAGSINGCNGITVFSS